jgi:hypothetical protein
VTGRPADEVLRHLAGVLVEAAPPDWTALRLTALSAGAVSTITVVADRPTGPVLANELPPDVPLLALELRDSTAIPGRGAWYVCRVEITGDGTVSASYDYDSQPPITPAPVPETYAEDLQRHPRGPDHHPAWLRDLLPHE